MQPTFPWFDTARSISRAALVLFAVGTGMAAAADDVPPIRALLVTGGCCHDYDTQKNVIAKGLAERANIKVTVVRQGGRTTDTKIPLYENPDWADGFDVVIHDECFSGVGDPTWTRRILAPHKKGLAAVVIHCAMHCYRDGTDQWFEFLRRDVSSARSQVRVRSTKSGSVASDHEKLRRVLENARGRAVLDRKTLAHRPRVGHSQKPPQGQR